jgi:hypothetical protein
MADLETLADGIRNDFERAKEAVKNDPKVRKHTVAVGELLFEARCQLTHKEFRDWIKRHFRMSLERAEEYMDAAYRARRSGTNK